MEVKKCRLIGLLAGTMLSSWVVKGQDSLVMVKALQRLSAPAMHGRGYVQGGLDSAANFLVQQLTGLGLKVQQQHFSFPVYTYPGRASLAINGKAMQPGKDFIMGPASRGFDGYAKLEEMDSTGWISRENAVILTPVKKLTWTVSTMQESYTHFQVREDALPKTVSGLQATVDVQFIRSFPSRNIIATVPGRRQKDSTIVFTAHYDHLGMLGKEAVFPGANDNASGTAFLLALAQRVKAEPLDYTAVFLFFSGEEAGLLGSQYYVKHPLLPLKNIRFLLNLDMMGNGDEGITVVNATVFEKEFALLQQINAEGKYLNAINSRGKAQNSDHYYFTEKGVPSFFWYTLGKRKAYHDVHDVAETVPYYEANDLVQCILEFSKQVILLPKK
ncbi:MAG TPA: M28 family peptidase [Phnomibacter sp.]|nr:M28 family peptidase [Phnomibacter sp.]